MTTPTLVERADGLEWMREQDSAGMVYFDPPYGHGTFGAGPGLEWVAQVVLEGMRVVGRDGIVYLHCDPQLLVQVSRLLPDPRGVIAWANGWVSGFKSKSTKFWPRQYHLIAGYAGEDWRLRPVRRPAAEYTGHGNPERSTAGFVYSDWWADPNPVDQMSWSREKVGYPTQKPLALLERLVLGSTDDDHLVLDPACGSGTALFAAVRTGRRAAGVDISEEAVQISRKRLRAYDQPSPATITKE